MDTCEGAHCPGCTGRAKTRIPPKAIIYGLGALTLGAIIERKPIAHAAVIAWHITIIVGLVIASLAILGALTLGAMAVRRRSLARVRVYVGEPIRAPRMASEPAARRPGREGEARALGAGRASLPGAYRAPRALPSGHEGSPYVSRAQGH